MNQSPRFAKFCRVCGDKALSFHFNGLTCSPCKMFFRRNADKSNQMKCSKGGNCTISFKTRKQCPSCRLNKCFDIGMTLEVIANRLPPGSGNTETQKDELDRLERLNLCDMIHGAIEQTLPPHQQKQEVDEEEEDTNSADQLYHFELDDIFFARKRNTTVELNEYEQSLIEEVQAASSVFHDESRLAVVGEVKSLVQAFNLYGLYVSRIIEYCKRIGAFKCMAQDDQLALLKPFYFELLAIRFSFLYDPTNDGYPVLENEHGNRAIFLRLGVINDTQKFHITDIHRKFKSILHLKMENDTAIRDLIMAQFLFKPYQCVTCPEFVRNQYYIYCYLLKRYLENKYRNISLASRKYSSLMALLDDFARSHYVREIFSAIDSTKVSHVLAEVFNVA